MNIQKIKSQSRRDFQAIYECEHCGHTHEGYGYDDANFHNNVIPTMECKQCGKKGTEDYRPLAPKHSANQVMQGGWQMNANVNNKHSTYE